MNLDLNKLPLHKFKYSDARELSILKAIKVVLIYEYFFLFFISVLVATILENALPRAILNSFTGSIAIILIYYIIMIFTLKNNLLVDKQITIYKVNFKHYLLVIFLMLGIIMLLFPTLYIVTTFIPDFMNIKPETSASKNMIFSLIHTCVLLPICEEFIHRKIILGGLTKKYSINTSLIISTLIFSLSHLSTQQAINVFPSGLILGLIYLRTRSIKLSITAHVADNTLISIIGLLNIKFNIISYTLFFLIGAFITIFLIKHFINTTTNPNNLFSKS